MHTDNYGTYEEGNTLMFHQFQQYLNDEMPQHNLNIEEHFMPRMKDIMIDSFLSVRNKMNPNRRKHVFELFGFDFLLDEDFRLWLIEINTNPFLGTPNKEMQRLVPQMVEDMVKLTVDPVFKPKNKPDEYDKNGFELIYREEQNNVPAVNHRRPFNLDLCYPIIDLKPFIGKPLKNVTCKVKTQKSKPQLTKRQEEPEPLIAPARSRSFVSQQPRGALLKTSKPSSPSQRSISTERSKLTQMTHKRHNSSSRASLKLNPIEPKSEITEAAVVEEDALSDNSDTAAASKIV